MRKSAGSKSESTFESENTSASESDTMIDNTEQVLNSADTSAGDSANGAFAAVKDQVQETAGQVKEKATQALEQGQQAAGQAVDKAKDSVKSQLSTQKEKAVSTLGNFTDALMHTGDQLRQSGQGVFGDYAETLADKVDHVAGYLRENDIDDLTAQVEDFARKQPALFIGGAFVVGVALARFLKSSQSNTSTSNGASGASYNATLPTPASAGALTTTPSTDYSSGSRQDQFSDDALPDTAPLSAHGYVTGIGVADSESSASSETASPFSSGSSD